LKPEAAIQKRPGEASRQTQAFPMLPEKQAASPASPQEFSIAHDDDDEVPPSASSESAPSIPLAEADTRDSTDDTPGMQKMMQEAFPMDKVQNGLGAAKSWVSWGWGNVVQGAKKIGDDIAKSEFVKETERIAQKAEDSISQGASEAFRRVSQATDIAVNKAAETMTQLDQDIQSGIATTEEKAKELQDQLNPKLKEAGESARKSLMGAAQWGAKTAIWFQSFGTGQHADDSDEEASGAAASSSAQDPSQRGEACRDCGGKGLDFLGDPCTGCPAGAPGAASSSASGSSGYPAQAPSSVSMPEAANSRSIANGGLEKSPVTSMDTEAATKEATDKAKKEAEEKAKKAAEEKAQKEAEEKAKKAAEEKAQKEAEEKAKKAAEEKAQKEAEEKAKKAAEEKAQKEAEEEAKKEAEEKARKEAEDRALQSSLQAESAAQPAANGQSPDADALADLLG